MTTTTAPNRIAPYLDEPGKQPFQPPATREGREALLTDAVFAAVAALQGLLTNPDPKVVMRAAEMILNLETTRQRHGRVLIGMEQAADHPSTESGLGVDCRPAVGEPPLRAAPTNGGDVGTTRCGGAAVRPRRTDVSNPLDLFIEKVRAELQSQEDADGTGVIVTREQAEECARFIQANAHHTPPLGQPPAGRQCHEEKSGNRDFPRLGILTPSPRARP